MSDNGPEIGQFAPKPDWGVHEALAFANTLANHGWTREANPDAASSCIYSLCRILFSPGNAAAMRDALEIISESLAMHVRCGRFVDPGDHVSFPISEAEAYIRDIRAALATPARNCDVGTADEQAERFEAECKRHDHCTPCPVKREWGEFKEGKPKSCQLIWGQMPFAPAEGGAV